MDTLDDVDTDDDVDAELDVDALQRKRQYQKVCSTKILNLENYRKS